MTAWCPSEHDEQKALFEWAALVFNRYPVLRLMYAIPNGGNRNVITAAKLKAEGVKAGMPDICLPIGNKDHNALYIEMKRQRGGRVSPEQKEIIALLEKAHNKVAVCKGFEAAKAVIEEYLSERT